MRLLIDTHILAWWLKDAPELPDRIKAVIRPKENQVFVSAASCWEIAIKVRIGRWPEAAGLVPGLGTELLRARLPPLPVMVSHAERAGLLEWEQRDPFDRLIVAQALEDRLTLVSLDKAFPAVKDLKLF